LTSTEITSGRPEIRVGLIDGPVTVNHQGLNALNIHEVSASTPIACFWTGSAACIHGTFVAGILKAIRAGTAPAIAPNCTLLVRPVFSEGAAVKEQMPSAAPEELAAAMVETIKRKEESPCKANHVGYRRDLWFFYFL
jgi:hypothetical protein